MPAKKKDPRKTGRPRTSVRDDGAVKIDKAIKNMAKRIAESRGISLAEYLSEMLRPGVQKDFADDMKRLQEGLPPPR